MDAWLGHRGRLKPADVARNAAWLVKAFEKRGLSARTLVNGAKPLVFAERLGGAGRTVLFYFHLDGQPVVQAEWSQPDAYQPVLKRRGAPSEAGQHAEDAAALQLGEEAPFGQLSSSNDAAKLPSRDPAARVPQRRVEHRAGQTSPCAHAPQG